MHSLLYVFNHARPPTMLQQRRVVILSFLLGLPLLVLTIFVFLNNREDETQKLHHQPEQSTTIALPRKKYTEHRSTATFQTLKRKKPAEKEDLVASSSAHDSTSTTESKGEGGSVVNVCGPVRKSVIARYSDLASFPLKTPDISVEAIIEVSKVDPPWRHRQQKIVEHHAEGNEEESKKKDIQGNPQELHDYGIVLCQRGRAPYTLALPGGYVEVGESLETAVTREIHEETSLELSSIALLRLSQDPKRDKRRHTVSAVYIANPKYKSSSSSHDDPFLSPSASPHFGVNLQQQLKAADDAKECKFYSWYELRKDFLMYDAHEIEVGPEDSPGGSERRDDNDEGSSVKRLEFAFDHRDAIRDYLVLRGVLFP